MYDGHTFPEYYYNNSLLSLNAEYGGRTELLQLPDEALAIKKAIDRLGAPSAEDCSYTVTFHNFKGDDWLARVQEIIAKEGIYETNAMLKALDVEGMDWSKLSAVVELADVQKASNIAFLAEHLDEFSFIPKAKTEEDVGHFLVDNISVCESSANAWVSYNLKDVSAAMYKAERKEGLSLDTVWKIY